MLALTSSAGNTYIPAIGTDELRGRLAAWYAAGRFSELTTADERHHRMEDAPVPMPDVIPDPAPGLNVLYWPIIGAARYAHAVFLLDGASLASLQADVTASSPAVTVSYTDAPDASDTPRTFPLYYVSARPVSQNGDANNPDLYFCLFCDIRYFWQNVTGGYDACTWLELIAGLAGLLPALSGVSGPAFTITDAPLAVYLTPSASWAASGLIGRSTAWLLDAAAACVGSRIVITPGVFTLQRPTDANQLIATAAYAANINRLSGGGLLTLADIQSSYPGAVDCVFPNPPVYYTGASDGGAPGRQTAWLDPPSTTPAADLLAIAAQWATDWSDWQDVPYEAQWIGFTAAPASGYLSALSIDHDAGWSRAHRPPLGYTPLYRGWSTPINVPACPPPGCDSGSGSGAGSGSGSGSQACSCPVTANSPWYSGPLVVSNGQLWQPVFQGAVWINPTTGVLQECIGPETLVFIGCLATCPGYSCVDGQCVEDNDDPQYTSAAACEQYCFQGSGGYSPGYECFPALGIGGSGLGVDLGSPGQSVCIQVETGGTYATEADCLAACGYSPGYSCVDGQCVYVSTGGAYATQAECLVACEGGGYNCVDGDCVYVSEGAEYATLAACQAACGCCTCPDMNIPITVTGAVNAGTYTAYYQSDPCGYSAQIEYDCADGNGCYVYSLAVECSVSNGQAQWLVSVGAACCESGVVTAQCGNQSTTSLPCGTVPSGFTIAVGSCTSPPPPVTPPVTAIDSPPPPEMKAHALMASRGTVAVTKRRFPLCVYRGGLVERPAGAKAGSQWVQCNHPDHPLKSGADPTGEKVCGCIGCSRMNEDGEPICPGYTDEPVAPRLEWVSTRRLIADSIVLAALLPADCSGVIAIPRSGMLPASIIATYLHLPLWTFENNHLVRCFVGRSRGAVAPGGSGRMAVVDDTVFSGNAMKNARTLLRGRPAVYTAVYVNSLRPSSKTAVDLYAKELPAPHLLEWNWANNGPMAGRWADAPVYGAGMALDLDGIIVHDTESGGRPGSPFMVPRAFSVKLIVTGRPERTRAETETLLRGLGVRWDRLDMLPNHLPQTDEVIANWKSQQFAASACGLFVESNPAQAERIWRRTAKPVICPRIEKVFQTDRKTGRTP